MNRIVSEAMNEPVACGGFIWSYGFLWQHLCREAPDVQCVNLYMGAATRRKPDFSRCLDVRSLPISEQERLWDAAGTGDMATMSQILSGLEAQ